MLDAVKANVPCGLASFAEQMDWPRSALTVFEVPVKLTCSNAIAQHSGLCATRGISRQSSSAPQKLGTAVRAFGDRSAAQLIVVNASVIATAPRIALLGAACERTAAAVVAVRL